ncbi:MAG: hypothetical protein AAF471_01995 [Myxococcota bacterium]
MARTLRGEGLRLGLQQGKLEKAAEIARNLLATGIDPRVISQATGLSHQKLTALRRK